VNAIATYKKAQEAYRNLLDEYGDALARRTADVGDIFERAADAWRVLVAVAPDGSPEKEAPHMNVVLAFSHAISADHANEARRLYEAMGDEERKNTDRFDADQPGSMKIWLRKDDAELPSR